MNAFVKDETTWEVLVLKFIKQKDPFMHLRIGVLGPSLDRSTGQQATAAARAVRVPLIKRFSAKKLKRWLLQSWRGRRGLQSEEEVVSVGHTGYKESGGTVFLFLLLLRATSFISGYILTFYVTVLPCRLAKQLPLAVKWGDALGPRQRDNYPDDGGWTGKLMKRCSRPPWSRR